MTGNGSMLEPDLRQGEVTTRLPSSFDASVYFIGRIRTPWRDRRDCPKRGDVEHGPPCFVEIDSAWHAAFDKIETRGRLEILYWMHLARRDLVIQNPKSRGDLFGTFALRSPMRPNPISSSAVVLLDVEPGILTVRGLDCVDGTPVIDVKPLRCPMWPSESAERG
jgi:tRNA-Thr(GGU) m(6)t(6)A37 methyltransferase TsaA